MSSRTYLSIGDVLTLLREEFPDVTISKIRFLESQGLVNPERSPSGYRKFFEPDVERLRWVLRQQREHFLPLKVIRDRLAEGNLDDSPIEVPEGIDLQPPTQSNGRGPDPARVTVGAGAGNGAAAGMGKHSIGSGAPAEAGRSEEQLTKADNEAMARILADASRRTARLPDAPPAVNAGAAPNPTPKSDAFVAGRPTPPAATAPAAPAAHAAATPAAPASSAAAAKANRQPPPAGTANKGVDVVAEAVVSASKGEPSKPGQGAPATPAARPPTGGTGRATGQAAPAKPPKSSTTSMVTGASLTADELCSASGLSEIELASLQGFGLIDSVVVAGIPTFDEDALTVANLAAELRVYGIEPRHLRLYRNAVDREVGLIEQVIIPLLRQRNPESRQRAIDSAEQLGTLGQTMRATLMRSALRRHLGG